MADPTLYGWTSAKMRASVPGTVLYARPDGSTVELDFVTSTPTCTESAWGDEVCVGEVTRCLRVLDPDKSVARW